MKASWEQVDSWLERAWDLPPHERAELLERECEDPAVRTEVRELLEAEASSGALFEPSDGFRRLLGGGFAPADDPSGRLVGRYRLDSLLGRGGMGTVWLAHRDDEAFDQRVAVKLIKRGLDTEETLRRFRHERQVLAGLEHPGIARLIDGGATGDGLPYMVLEYVEGIPVDRWCAERLLSVRQRLELFRSLCDAVQFAHQSLVVHRDLKPTNILVGQDGAPKLLDFGIAKMLDPEGAGLTGTLPGSGPFLTPEYASPEQVQGLPVTTSTDVYSLGVVLYQLLTGALPYRLVGRAPAEIERVVCHEEPRRPSSVVDTEDRARRRALSGDLDTIVLKALRKSPDRRYASVEQFSEDIRRHLVGLPVTARPDSVGYRVGKLVRRHRVSVAALTLVFLTMAISLAVITGLLSDARSAEETAQRRFGQVRSLANEVLFDLHDAIAQVPGATAARHQLVQTGLRYLDGLAAEAGKDAELLLELVAGYAQLAEVQGRPTAASLGETTAALESYGHALELLARVQTLRPSDEQLPLERARLEDLAGTLELRLGRTAEALEGFERTSDTLRSLGDEGDLATGLYHQVEALMLLGRTEAALEVGRECLEVARRQVAIDASDREARRTLQVVLFKLADLHSANRDMQLAESEVLESIELAEGLRAEFPAEQQPQRDLALALAMLARIRIEDARPAEAEDAVTRQLEILERLHAVAYERVGSLHAAQGRLEEALDSYRHSAELDEEVVAADPEVNEWRRDLALAHEKIVGTALGLGRNPEARESAARMVDLLEPLVADDSDDLASARPLALAYFRFAQLDLEDGDHAAAGAGFSAAADTFAVLSAADPEDAWTRRMAMVAVYFVGWVHREQGHDTSLDPDARRQHLRSACTELERSLELHAELERLGMLQSGDEQEAESVLAEIDACSALLEELDG